MKIALIMLAAGNSRRFGSNKLLYEIEGKPMYRHILEKLMIVAEWLEKQSVLKKWNAVNIWKSRMRKAIKKNI